MGADLASDNIMKDMAGMNEDSEVTPEEVEEGFIFMAGVSMGLIVFVSLLGCCSGHLRNKICLGIYGFFALVIMIVLFVYGGIMMGVATLGDGYCTKDRAAMSEGEREWLKETDKNVEKIDQEVGEVINSKMCTYLCPCYMGETGEIIEVYEDAFDEEDLNEYGRSWYGFYDQFEDEEYEELVWSIDPENSFLSIEECMEWLQEINEAYGGDYDVEDDVPLTEKEREMVAYFEEKYECAGLCDPPIFYFSKSIEDGPPKSGCFESMWDDIAAILNGLGTGPFVSAIMIFLSFFCMYPICCYNRDLHLGVEQI